MIKIEPYFDNEPKELWEEISKQRYKTLKNPSGYSKITLALNQRTLHEFDRTIYGSKIIKDRLKTIFNKKCAFCETNTHSGAHKDVEHFRFKSHYYWLGYEWSNLLLSCQICNRDFKAIYFPLENENYRLMVHPCCITGELDKDACDIRHLNTIEKPLLLHPATDDPRVHLCFLANGKIEQRSIKGENSIKTYGLNRKELVLARKQIIREIRLDILEEYEHTRPSQERVRIEIAKVINKLMKRIANKETQYIGFATAILENFEAFIIDNKDEDIDMPDKEIMRQTAKAILNP